MKSIIRVVAAFLDKFANIISVVLLLIEVVLFVLSRLGVGDAPDEWQQVARAASFAIPLAVFLYSAYRVYRERNIQRGMFELAHQSHLHTMRMVSLVSHFREKPDDADLPIDMADANNIPIETALFSYDIYGIGQTPQTNGQASSRTASSVWLDYRFTVPRRTYKLTRCSKVYSFVAWLFGDNFHEPEDCKIYYGTNPLGNSAKKVSTCIYRNVAFDYPFNDGLYVVNHAIDTSLLDDSRSFGITYWKEACVDWSYHDAFIIYPSAFSSKIGRMSISLRIDVQLWKDLNDNGTVDLSVQEIACDGRRVHRGKIVAALIDKGEEEERGCKWRKLATREFSCSAENVYLVLIRPDRKALSWVKGLSSGGSDTSSGGGAPDSVDAGGSGDCDGGEAVCDEE